MFSITRAAAYAVAFITMAASAAFADPSMAWDVESAPITSRYIDHASADLDGSALATNPQGPARLAHDVDFSTPVATHAVAAVGDSAVSTAMFFHATYVRPGWHGLTRVASVGNHIFYR